MTLTGARVTQLLTRREEGAAALFIVAIFGALVLAAGLIADGSAKVAAVRHAQSVAQEAARAAGQQLEAGAITGDATLGGDPGRGVAAANAYLAASGQSGSVSVDGEKITVTTSQPWQPKFFPGGGTATGEASVRIATSR